MPSIKFSLNDEHYQKLVDMAAKDGISIQDYIRNKLFDINTIYTPAEAVLRATKKYKSGDIFTLPEIYAAEWDLKRGLSGVFGKQFYNYVSDVCPDLIEFVGMTKDGRHAQYRKK